MLPCVCKHVLRRDASRYVCALQSYLADPLAAAVALGLDIGNASEPPAHAAAEPAPDGAAAAPNSTAAGATAAPAAAPEAAAAAAAAGAGPPAAEHPNGVPPPGAALAASAKRKRDRSSDGKSRSGTGKRSKRQAPRELASLQVRLLVHGFLENSKTSVWVQATVGEGAGRASVIQGSRASKAVPKQYAKRQHQRNMAEGAAAAG